jgi:cbb3-type cytochrome oxidase maturation protein
MELIFVLLPFALLFAGAALALFIWAARSGQFDDLHTPAVRVLFDEEDDAPHPATAAAGRRRPLVRLEAKSGTAHDASGQTKERP